MLFLYFPCLIKNQILLAFGLCWSIEFTSVYFSHTQLFLERERAAILAEAKTDDLISEAPKPALDQSGEWQETSGEIQWVAAETNDSQADKKESEKKEEEDEELDLNKGGCWCVSRCLCTYKSCC